MTFSCEFDYDLGESSVPFKPQVVLNSTIAPHKPIDVVMLWSRLNTSDINIAADSVDSFEIRIYEDDKLILDSIGKNGLLETNLYPKAGSTYTLEANVLNYGSLAAETYIPSKSYRVKIEYTKMVDSDPDNIFNQFGNYFYYEINPIDISEQTRALWIIDIIPAVLRIDYPPDWYYRNCPETEIFVTNPYLDQVNAVIDPGYMHQVAARGSVVEHEGGFLRVPFKNLSKVFPVDFSIYIGATVPYDGSNYYLESVSFSVITPSYDYDRYRRDICEQYQYLFPMVPLFNENIHIYNNIKGGLGSFAGYLQEVVTIDYPIPTPE